LNIRNPSECYHQGRRVWALHSTPKGSVTLETFYHHGDHLGPARLTTSENGYPTWSSTFLPFGQEWNPQITVNHYKFTGKERDSESNLDHFGARYNSSQYGRFMTPDPDNAGSLEQDPQSWNGYAYARNNPLNLTDPEGLSYSVCITDTDGTEHCTTYNNDSDFYQAVHDSPGASFDSGNKGNIYANGQVVGTFTHSGNGSSDTVGTSEDTILAPILAGGLAGGIKAGVQGIVQGVLANGAKTAAEGTLAAGAEEIVAAGAKGVVRQAVQDSAISDAQKVAVKQVLNHARGGQDVVVQQLADGTVRVVRAVMGSDSVGGHAEYVADIALDGTRRTVQYGSRLSNLGFRFVKEKRLSIW